MIEEWANEAGLAELASASLAVQDACNLVGIVRSYALVLVRLQRLCPELSSRQLAQHPIAVAWASKIADLTCVGSTDVQMDAFAQLEAWKLPGTGRQVHAAQAAAEVRA